MTDGDTVKVRVGGRVRKTYRIRLLGIDTPETRKPGTPVECGGREATSAMLNLGFTQPQDTNGDNLFDRRGGTGVRVDLTTDRTQKLFDRFKRLLVYVDVPAGARGSGVPRYDLSRTMIAGGFSRVYTFRRRVARFRRYRETERQARAAGRGV